jgi:hypothetical protein
MNEGVNIPPRGKFHPWRLSSPLGVKFTLSVHTCRTVAVGFAAGAGALGRRHAVALHRRRRGRLRHQAALATRERLHGKLFDVVPQN